MTTRTPASAAPSPSPAIALLAGAILLISPLLSIAMLPSVTLPWWESDPLMSEAIVVGLTPSWHAWLLACSAVGALVLIIAAGPPARSWWIMAGLVALGAAPVLWHGWLAPERSFEHARVGSAWLAGALAALTLAHAGRHEVVQRAVGAALLGAVLVMALKGAAQLLVEHPALVQSFKAQREQIFAANGWTPDSPMARAYERRLMQPEATGWLGFSNIYASLCASGAAAALAMLVARFRENSHASSTAQDDSANSVANPRKDWPTLALALAFSAGVAGVAMAGGKGGWGVLIIGCVLALALTLGAPMLRARSASPSSGQQPRLHARRIPTLITWAAPTLCAAMLALVALRGLAGDRLGELSILFRAYYIQASARMVIDGATNAPNPAGADLPPVTGPMGTGPAGFKDAYVVYKNPRQPEDVASPHSATFDWAACLGPLGLAWSAVSLWWLLRAGRAARDESLSDPAANTTEANPAPGPQAARAACLIAATATIAAIPHVSIALTPDELFVRVGGLMLWCAAAAAIAHVAAGTRVALLCAAGVLAMHAMIEQSAHWPASAPLLGVVVGLAAARAHPTQTTSPRAMPTRLLAGVIPLALAVALVVYAGRATAWESHLFAAVKAIGADVPLKDRQAQRYSPSVPMLEAAAEELLLADRAASSFVTRREASRLLVLASQMTPPPQPAQPAQPAQPPQPSAAPAPDARYQLMHRAAWATVPNTDHRRHKIKRDTPAGSLPDPWPVTPAPTSLTLGENAHLALMFSAATRWLTDPTVLQLAIAHQEITARQDPSAPLHALRLMELRARASDPRGAAAAAQDALARDALQTYDRASRALTDRQRASAQRAIDAATQPKAQP